MKKKLKRCLLDCVIQSDSIHKCLKLCGTYDNIVSDIFAGLLPLRHGPIRHAPDISPFRHTLYTKCGHSHQGFLVAVLINPCSDGNE